MPRRDLPPLRALESFEAAARLGSFHRAADELGVTRSAISHQIRSLEQHLGLSLFRRDGRRAELTSTGHLYYPAVKEAFDKVATQTQALRPAESDNELSIQVYATVAVKWLIPRLHLFEKKYPDMKVRLRTSFFSWDFDEDAFDAAILLGRKLPRAHHIRRLFPSALIPLVSPVLLENSGGLQSPAELANFKLLHVEDAREDWDIWLNAAGLAPVAPDRGIAYDSYILAQEAAVEGQGIAMSIGPFAQTELAVGSLVEPFNLLVPHKYDWIFVANHAQRDKRKIRRFENWLLEQVEADQQIARYRDIVKEKQSA